MRRHAFEPGKLVAGLAVLSACLLYSMDAAGRWHIPAFVVVPVIVGGLCLAGAVSVLAYVARRRRTRRTESAAPPHPDVDATAH